MIGFDFFPIDRLLTHTHTHTYRISWPLQPDRSAKVNVQNYRAAEIYLPLSPPSKTAGAIYWWPKVAYDDFNGKWKLVVNGLPIFSHLPPHSSFVVCCLRRFFRNNQTDISVIMGDWPRMSSSSSAWGVAPVNGKLFFSFMMILLVVFASSFESLLCDDRSCIMHVRGYVFQNLGSHRIRSFCRIFHIPHCLWPVKGNRGEWLGREISHN